MKGFTLIEVIVYIAVSTIITTALVSFYFTLSENQNYIKERISNESEGLTLLKTKDEQLKDHKTGEVGLVNVSFELNKQNFSASFYVKP